jgi:hypothetical protein
MTRGHKRTKEEVIAEKIVEFVSDLRLDLDLIGLYLGRYIRTTIWLRIEHIYETAKYHREKQNDPKEHYEYIKNVNS